MSELETFAQIIKNILSNDNEVRKQSEELLNVTKDRNPDEYFLGLLELLKGKHILSLFRASYSSLIYLYGFIN